MQYSQVRVPAEQLFTEDLSSLFNAQLVQTIIREAKVEANDNIFLALHQGHNLKVEKDLTPDVYTICQEVQESLEFQESIEFFIDSAPEYNAYSLSRIEDDQPHIITINSGIVDNFSPDELRFIIGHEIGHLISKNSELRRVVKYIYPPEINMSPFLVEKLETWEKLSELTADRFGYFAIPDLAVARSAFFRLSSGLDAEKVGFNAQAYQDSMDEILEFFKKSNGPLSSTHPVNPIRLKALQMFAESETFSSIQAGRELAEDANLSEQLQELTELIINKGDSPLAWERKRFFAAAGLLMANVDDEVHPDEIKSIIRTLSLGSHFPRQLLDQIVAQGDLRETFMESAKAILEINPAERRMLFLYMIDLAISDRNLKAEEAKFLFACGEQMFGYQRKEIAQIIAEVLQKDFIPDLFR